MTSNLELIAFIEEQEQAMLDECIKLINTILKLDEQPIHVWNRITREKYKQRLYETYKWKRIYTETLVVYRQTKQWPKYQDIRDNLDLLKIFREADYAIKEHLQKM